MNLKTQPTLLKVISLIIALCVAVAGFTAPAAAAPDMAPQAVRCIKMHTVAAGDTVSSIANQYNIKMRQLVYVNTLKRPYKLTVGTTLCIPEGAELAKGTTAANSTQFTVSLLTNHFVIQGKSLPGKSAFNVLIFNGANRIKIGSFKTDKNGAANQTYEIPKAVRDVKYFRVCLKNATTDEIACVNITR